MDPKVSFIIPCYKLAHFLDDCLSSIIRQTYGDFETLIMDDCSPDNTPEVVAEYKDPRVRYVRNETNLGHLRNYNKGIELSRGKYIWLISADDCLRSQNVVQKYVDLLEKNPQVGYVFCPAMYLTEAGEEVGVADLYAWPGARDRILSGREVVRHSAYSCPVCSPTGLVRKECYSQLGDFPLNLPRTGDWYLWAIFATRYEVGYFAEPMVCYRWHSTNMDNILKKEQPSFFREQEMQVRQLIKKEAEKAGIPWGIKPRIFLWGLMLERSFERLFGTRLVQLVPWLRMFKNALQ
jgi:glycosyltransferase involved in cell wall biosynthesis